MASCVLHNFLRIRLPSSTEGDFVDPRTREINPGSWRVDRNLESIIDTPTAARSTQAARIQRNNLRDYFDSPQGSVPWQNAMI